MTRAGDPDLKLASFEKQTGVTTLPQLILTILCVQTVTLLSTSAQICNRKSKTVDNLRVVTFRFP